MTDLTTKTAQSLHDKWCEQMREKGWHGPDGLGHDFIFDASIIPCGKLVLIRPEERRYCDKFHADLIPWPDLPESRRQEYLATAKAVLPEIVGEILNESKIASALYCGVPKNVRHAIEAEGYVQTHWEAAFAKIIVDALRDRRLEELKK